MATYTRLLLSGSTNGRQIPVAATATAGTLIHTAVTGTTSFDEIYLWVSNVTATERTLVIEWGGVTNPGDHLVSALPIPANCPRFNICTGEVLNNGLIVRAFASVTNALNMGGYVNRIT